MRYPKISILVAAYKEEEVIENALNHLLNEVKYPNKEVLVAVDTKDDKTLDIVKRLAKKYKNLKYDFSSRRRGMAGALDSVLKKSTGEIIVKNDADIRFENPKTCLFKLVEYYKDPTVGGVGFLMVDSKLDSEKKKSLTSRGEIFIQRLVYTWFEKEHPVIEGSWNLPLICNSFRKKIIFEINHEVICDDAEYGYNVIENGYKLVFASNNF